MDLGFGRRVGPMAGLSSWANHELCLLRPSHVNISAVIGRTSPHIDSSTVAFHRNFEFGIYIANPALLSIADFAAGATKKLLEP